VIEKIELSFMHVVPSHGSHQRIGLLGGSFNPAHDGHRLISVIAMKRLKLDAVWWLVSPANPLKDVRELAPLSERMKKAKMVSAHPRILITDIGTRYTVDTLRQLRKRCPATYFVWLMGADSLMSFHRWKKWREIPRLMPMVVIDRPKATLKSTHSKAALALARYRCAQYSLQKPTLQKSAFTLKKKHPQWIFLYGQRSPLSSTQLRHPK
jgi:nicotinate-nucleotide adenylyltransferase